MSFEDYMEGLLESLNKKQLRQFSWVCGLRALPLLGIKRGFAYWPKNEKQKHLYSISYALDVGAQAVFLYDFGVDATYAAANAAYAAANAAANATAYDTVTRAAANAAARAAANAAIASATHAYDAVTRAAAAYAAITRDTTNFDLKSFLFKDIEAIKENRLNICNHDTSIYGELWDNFQKDLVATGCAYWARYYEDLFNNGFNKIDKEELKRHLGVPDEIKAEGAASVGRYFDRLGDKLERFNEARIIILGEKGAGKTSLARKLRDIDAGMPEGHESTTGVERRLWDFPDKDGIGSVNAHIWDFAGHSITHSAHRCFMSARCLYIYVYNGRIERDNDPSYWLEQIRIHGGDSPVLFLINEKDDHKADIAEKTLKKEYPSIAGYYRVDIGNEKNTTKLEEFRQKVMDMVRNNPSWNNQSVSLEAYTIKSKLREHFYKTRSPHITREQFNEIARKCGVHNEHVEDILEDLHTLGICLWYNKEEMEDFNTLVLNPDWITNGIYRIINKGFTEHEHILTVQKGTEILRDDKRYKYPRDKVAFLFRLMKVYELAFFKNTDRIFIPGILSIDMPDRLPIFDNANDRLTMSFVVEKVLPPNIVSRIMVQRHNEIFDEDLLWRKGAVLKFQGDTIALITEDVRSVTVRVKGADKTAYVASMRETIQGIFKSYKNIKPDLQYEVLRPEETKTIDSIMINGERHEPLMLSENIVDVHTRKRMPYLDPVTERLFSLFETVIAYGVNNTTNIYNAPINIELNNSILKLNDLVKDLRNEMFIDDADYVEEVVGAVGKVQEVINTTPNEAEVVEKIKRKRWFVKIKEFFEEFIDENSDLNKNIGKWRNSVEKMQTILRVYNDLVKMIPGLKAILPEIPDAILNIGRKNTLTTKGDRG